jgi:hypothetical protein
MDGLGGKEMSQTLLFMAEVVGVFDYFNCFPDDAGMVGLDVGYDFCSVEADAVFSSCRVFSYC